MRLALTISILLSVGVMTAGGKKYPDLTLRDLSGKKVQLSNYRGKIVVLNFWATWCGPCREEMPMLVKAGKIWAAKGVTFIAVSLDDDKTKDEIPSFISRYHVDYPVWTGATSDELDRFHMGQGVPDTAFVDEDGAVIARVLGEIKREELDQRLEWLTGDRKSPPPAAVVHHM
jgi:thiol-disulfide isomerase/thioredoxin